MINKNSKKYIICTLAVVTTHDKSPLCAAMIILKLLMIEFSFCNLPFSANMPKNKIFSYTSICKYAIYTQ